MILNVFYSKTFPIIIKRRTKHFFRRTNFIKHGNVYSYSNAKISLLVNKTNICISVYDNCDESVALINDYISNVFKNKEIFIYCKDRKFAKIIQGNLFY